MALTLDITKAVTKYAEAPKPMGQPAPPAASTTPTTPAVNNPTAPIPPVPAPKPVQVGQPPQQQQPQPLKPPAPVQSAPVTPVAPAAPQPQQAQPAQPTTTVPTTASPATPVAPAQQQPAAQPDIDALVAKLPPDNKLTPEQQKQFAGQVSTWVGQNQELLQGAKEFTAGQTNTPGAKQFAAALEQRKNTFIEEQLAAQKAADPAAAATPQGWAGMMNNAMQSWEQMPQEMKWVMGLGLGGGLLGMASLIFGEGGLGAGMLGLLGLGAAGVAGAAGGMFGQGASNMVGDAAYNAGTFLGVIPEGQQDLSALMADDPIAALTSGGGGKDLSRDAVSQQVADGRAKAEQLRQLMNAPVGPEVKMRLMQRLDPRIDSPEAAQKAYANAETLLKAYDDAESPLSQKLQQAEQYGADKSWMGWVKEKALNSGLVKPGSDTMNTNDLITRLTEKWAGAASEPVAPPKRKKAPYKLPEKFVQPKDGATPVRASVLKKATVVELCQKAARCWAGYEPVPGAKAYSKGSCRPKGSKKTQKEMKKT